MVSLDSIIEEVRDYLNIDRDVKIDKNTIIASLTGINGETLEPCDLLGILYNLGIRASDYCSGERLNRKGYDMLQSVISLEGSVKDYESAAQRISDFPHDTAFPIITTTEVAEKITPCYLLRIVEYDAGIKKAA